MVMGTTHPIRWLLTDDWREPSVTWTLPDWFLRNVTMVWLVRSDHMHLPIYEALSAQERNPMTALLDLRATDSNEPE